MFARLTQASVPAAAALVAVVSLAAGPAVTEADLIGTWCTEAMTQDEVTCDTFTSNHSIIRVGYHTDLSQKYALRNQGSWKLDGNVIHMNWVIGGSNNTSYVRTLSWSADKSSLYFDKTRRCRATSGPVRCPPS